MEKWTIRPAPAPFDPQRHLLLVKGVMKDLSLIVKKFGSLCGRPTPANAADGYNFSIYLHGLTQLGLDRVTVTLNEMFPQAASSAPAVIAAAPLAAPLAAHSATAAPEAPAEATPPRPAPEPPRQAPQPPASAPPPAPALEPVAPAGAVSPAALRRSFGFKEKIDAARGFDSLIVGPFNRFAHAAAASVVGAPGTMYNPMFLHGAPGVGKTHLLQAIGAGLGETLGAENIILTSGGRLTRAANLALAGYEGAAFEAELARAKALLVDDVHLLSVGEANSALLSKAFNFFFSRNLQVVMTSIYPPRALGALEEALKISISRGWSVDLKLPGPSIQLEIINAFLDKRGANIPSEDVKKFHEMLGKNYFESERWIRRFLVFLKLRESSSEAQKCDELLSALFDPGVRVGSPELPSPAELQSVQGFMPPAPGPQARGLALLVPKGQEAMAPWVASRFAQAAELFKIPDGGYRQVLTATYDAGQPFGVPFQIGEMCANAGADVALVLGPAADSSLASREAEFSHAVVHVLESLGIAAGWIAHRGTMFAGPFLRAHLDFLARGA